MEKIITLIVSGYYTDWFFNVFVTQLALAVKNNMTLLLLLAWVFAKVSKMTKNTRDDKWSAWFSALLGKLRPSHTAPSVKPVKQKKRADRPIATVQPKPGRAMFKKPDNNPPRE